MNQVTDINELRENVRNAAAEFLLGELVAFDNTRPATVYLERSKEKVNHKGKFHQFIVYHGEPSAIIELQDGTLITPSIAFIRFDDVNGGEDDSTEN